jgi:hypothetical protein
MMLSGTVYQLPPSAPLTGGTGFGSSPTHSIPTPTTQDHTERECTSTEALNYATNKSVSLDRFVKQWPTPRANDAEKRGEIANDPRNGLPAAVKYWPTPAASEARLGYQRRDTGKKGTQQSLTTIVIDEERKRVVHQFATPQARDYRTGQIERWENPERSRNLNDQIGGSLSADWVEALMGFPIGWTFISEKQ